MIHGFELLREQPVPEINTRVQMFRHVKTGAELLSLQNDDENKVFGISFRTPPENSTGVAHILEHGVLAGSRKYPLKDPFAELLKGSLKTFLNAMTYPDKTVYPVASTNLQDFYNLVDVYLDTVFYPLLRRQTFEQQGWHYELEQAEQELIYKGVVFNEMKGVYSSPDSMLYRYTQQDLFPDTIYGVDSGGDPQHIPDLTYEQFVAFHRAYYHPSNARIWFYGDDDPVERLRILDAYLKDFDPRLPSPAIAPQPLFTEPRQTARPYAAGSDGPDGHKSMLNVAWVLGEPPDAETVLGLDILEHILIGTTAAPLRKTLIDSGLGEKLTGSGLSTSLRQLAFWVGLKGVSTGNEAAVEPLVIETLAQLARDGIDPATVAASLNTVEFSLRENNTGSYPRGLSLMTRALTTWLYGGDPLEPIAFEAPLAAIKARLARGERYFEGLIKRFYMHNPHRVTIVLQPDGGLTERNAVAERARLDAARTAMSPDEVQALVENTHALKHFQETPDPPEVIATVPSLTLADLPREAPRIPSELHELGGARVLYHELFTNGICYLDVGLDLHTLPQDLLPLLPLFGRALLEHGTERESFVQLSQRIGRATGGISPGSYTSASRVDRRGAAWLFLRGKATVENTSELLAILRDILLTARLDNRERFRQLVLESKASIESALVPSGNAYVSSRLRSQFNEADWASEQKGGIGHLFFLRTLAEQVDHDWPAVLRALERIRALLVNRNALMANLTLDAAGWQRIRPQLETFLADLPAQPVTPVVWTPEYGAGNEGLTIPATVNYVGKGADLYRLGYQLHGSASVISRYLRSTWLWERVRVQGGAYGGHCSFDQRSGLFVYTSYRDPNLQATIEVYDQTGGHLRELALSPANLTRAVIGTIGDLDAYQLPDAKGFTALWRYLLGEDDPWRQQYRDEILGTTAVDFRAFADVLDAVRDHGTVVVLGGAPAIESAASALPGWLTVRKVL
jgi:hypothetical protein